MSAQVLGLDGKPRKPTRKRTRRKPSYAADLRQQWADDQRVDFAARLRQVADRLDDPAKRSAFGFRDALDAGTALRLLEHAAGIR